MAKFGERFFEDMVDRGRRELGGVLFTESNVAQAMYPLHGRYGETRGIAGWQDRSLAERLNEPEAGREDPGREEPDMGLERE